MSQLVHPPETDLIVPLTSEDGDWNPHTIHTHYFGFCAPDAGIGVFTYIRYQPYFPLSQGGVLIYRGADNPTLSAAAFHDYQTTMPWPRIEGNTFTTDNGLRYDFTEPGKRVLITYRSADGRATIDVEASAVTPLAVRGHVMPGEELHSSQAPGGSEQFMHYTGEITLAGERYAIDCHYPRDRSWRQVRTESRDANLHPPISWTPIYFDEDLAFNQVGFEDPGSDPAWKRAFDIPEGAPTHHFAWVSRGGTVREVTRVRCAVTRTHPTLLAPLAMEIDATDALGDTYRITGEAINLAPLPSWPNIASYESVFRWRDEHGRVAHGPVQSVWGERAEHGMRAGRAS